MSAESALDRLRAGRNLPDIFAGMVAESAIRGLRASSHV